MKRRGWMQRGREATVRTTVGTLAVVLVLVMAFAFPAWSGNENDPGTWGNEDGSFDPGDLDPSDFPGVDISEADWLLWLSTSSWWLLLPR
jgi:hypothetical protein